MTKRGKFSALPNQKTLAEAYGVTARTIRNWKRKNPDFGKYPTWLGLAREWRQAAAAYPKGKFGRLFRASIVLHKICPGHIVEKKQRELYYETKLADFIHPDAAKRDNKLYVAAEKLRLAGKEITRQTLARELCVHPRTVNRRYGIETMRKLCPIIRRRKPLIESKGKPYNLAA